MLCARNFWPVLHWLPKVGRARHEEARHRWGEIWEADSDGLRAVLIIVISLDNQDFYIF